MSEPRQEDLEVVSAENPARDACLDADSQGEDGRSSRPAELTLKREALVEDLRVATRALLAEGLSLPEIGILVGEAGGAPVVEIEGLRIQVTTDVSAEDFAKLGRAVELLPELMLETDETAGGDDDGIPRIEAGPDGPA